VLHEECSIANLAIKSLQSVCRHVGITTPFVESSTIYNNKHLSGEDRILDICKKENADEYINLIGGKHLYSKTNFAMEGIDLKFLSPRLVSYNQYHSEFIPWLSIIDVLFFNSVADIQAMIGERDIE
jgi:hypothetical protein